MEGQMVITKEDHLCAKCREVMPAGSTAWEVPAQTSTPNQWGNERWITVLVRYHPEHFVGAAGLGSNS